MSAVGADSFAIEGTSEGGLYAVRATFRLGPTVGEDRRVDRRREIRIEVDHDSGVSARFLRMTVMVNDLVTWAGALERVSAGDHGTAKLETTHGDPLIEIECHLDQGKRNRELAGWQVTVGKIGPGWNLTVTLDASRDSASTVASALRRALK